MKGHILVSLSAITLLDRVSHQNKPLSLTEQLFVIIVATSDKYRGICYFVYTFEIPHMNYCTVLLNCLLGSLKSKRVRGVPTADTWGMAK